MEDIAGVNSAKTQASDQPVIIGIDHGFAHTKTEHVSFPSGYYESESPPAFTGRHCMQIDGSYLDFGTRRFKVDRDRLSNARMYMLTLGAIAGELKARGLAGSQKVIVAAGVPIADFTEEKRRAVAGYLLSAGRSQVIPPDEQTPVTHHILLTEAQMDFSIVNAQVYPQGYAAVAAVRPECLAEPALNMVDIGGWTIDTLAVRSGAADPESVWSHETGIIAGIAWVRARLERNRGMHLVPEQIEAVLRDESAGYLEPETIGQIWDTFAEWMQDILQTLFETGCDPRKGRTLVLGGGAILMRNLLTRGKLPALWEKAEYILDPAANAAGFARLYEAEMRGGDAA